MRPITHALRVGCFFGLMTVTACAPMTVRVGALPVATIGAEAGLERPMPEVDRPLPAAASHSVPRIIPRDYQTTIAVVLIVGMALGLGVLLWAAAS